MRFLFDFLSPYAYIAWKQLPALAARHDRRIEPVPVLLAAILDHHGHKGPAEIPGKREYVFRNVLRVASRVGLTITPPPAHPFNPMVALRVASLDHPERERIIDVLFDAVWGGGPGIVDAAAVKHVLDAAGFDGAALVAAADGAKGTLRRATEGAIAAGVFGVPTVIVDGELFWGFDSFPDIEAFLRGGDPVDPVAIARWRDLPAAATRVAGPHYGLTHLSLLVSDVEASVRFYGALGYAPYFRDEKSVQVVRAGGKEVIALEVASEGVGVRGGIDHFGFRLSSPAMMDKVLPALLAAGGALIRRGEFSPGLPYAYVSDPAGYTVEIWFE